MTLVLPFAPREVPIQVRIVLYAAGRHADRSERVLHGLGRLDPWGQRTRDVLRPSAPSSPLRARTWMPGRFTRTLISWNLPSDGAWVELYPSR